MVVFFKISIYFLKYTHCNLPYIIKYPNNLLEKQEY